MQPWLSERDLRPDASMRLFCLPPAGSGAAAFYRWKRLLRTSATGTSIDVCPIHLPGRESRLAEPPATDAAELLPAILEAIKPALDVPYALFGHSMGALLAYALAAEIERAGLPPPRHLIVSGRDAAHLPPSHPRLQHLPERELLAELSTRFGSVSAGIMDDPELRDVFLPILRADLQVVDSFPPARTLLHCPITALAGVDDRSVTEAGLAAWAELTDGAFTQQRLAGGHFCHLGPAQEALLALIAERLQTPPSAR